MCRYKNSHSAQTMISYKRKQMQSQADSSTSPSTNEMVDRGKVVKMEDTVGQPVVKRGRKRKDPTEDVVKRET